MTRKLRETKYQKDKNKKLVRVRIEFQHIHFEFLFLFGILFRATFASFAQRKLNCLSYQKSN